MTKDLALFINTLRNCLGLESLVYLYGKNKLDSYDEHVRRFNEREAKKFRRLRARAKMNADSKGKNISY